MRGARAGGLGSWGGPAGRAAGGLAGWRPGGLGWPGGLTGSRERTFVLYPLELHEEAKARGRKKAPVQGTGANRGEWGI